jgi:Subtilase family
MCSDYVSGQLILCFPKADVAARELVEDIRREAIEHVSYGESLEQVLVRLELKADETLPFEFHRVHVPENEEHWKITYLQFFYKHKLIKVLSEGQVSSEFMDSLRRSDLQFTVAPNYVMSLASGLRKVQAADFKFSQFHEQYKARLNLPVAPPADLNLVEIAIIDSGIADDVDLDIPTNRRRNFVEHDKRLKVTDENGHGTVVASIIHDLAPTAQLRIYKVADSDGRVSEWDTLAALAASARAQVINLSLQFGLRDRVCEVCGRESGSSRSAVFENIVGHTATPRHKSIIVGAAGNQGLGNLAFPARFGSVLAVGAINSKGDLSAESNYGNQNNDPVTPDNHFVCPGGDDATVPPETVGSFSAKDAAEWHGTSFAAAYATGVVANLVANEIGKALDYDGILKQLRLNADTNTLNHYDPNKHGHGIMRFSN